MPLEDIVGSSALSEWESLTPETVTPNDTFGRWRLSQMKSAEGIYQALMQGGGEPFGPPFPEGLATLTEKVVGYFRQKGFFAFESLEKLGPRNKRNKFTRAGAAPFVGKYKLKNLPK